MTCRCFSILPSAVWIFTQISSDLASHEGLDIAISTTNDPLGSYYHYYIRAASSDLAGCGGVDCLPDYPKAGYDANGFYISVDLFNASSGIFVKAVTYAVSKTALKNGAKTPVSRALYPNDFVVQPSVPAPGEPFVTAANGTELLMEARAIISGQSRICVWALSNTASLNTSKPSTGKAVDLVVSEPIGATVPSTQPNQVGPYCASKGVTSAPQLDGGYNAFQSTIQMASGQLSAHLLRGR